MIDVGTPEPMPTGTGEDVGDSTATYADRLGYPEVADDLQVRISMGEKKYNTRLKTNNGRNAIKDAYEECLDACQYLMQCVMEGTQDSALLIQAFALTVAIKKNLNAVTTVT